MKKIKVWLQYPWKFPDSPYYKYLIENPLEGLEYLNVKKQKGVITSSKKFRFMNKLKKYLRKILEIIKMPNIIKTKKGEYDVIHCAHCLSLNKKPWIVDVEHYWNFASSGKIAYSKKGKEKIKKFLKSPYCKKIIPWTEAAKKTIISALRDKDIEKKIEVVYPAIPLIKFKKKNSKKLVLLFVGRYFYSKGGVETLEVFDDLTRKFKEIECIFVSDTPKEFKEKYSKNKKIKFYDLMPQKELFKIYEKSDIFVYPGYSDSFGFALLEVMAFGIPIITANGFAREEIVENGKTGYIIYNKDKKIMIEKMINKISKLLKDKKLLKSMGKEARKEIEKGKFSIKQRNKKLEKIYREALK